MNLKYFFCELTASVDSPEFNLGKRLLNLFIIIVLQLPLITTLSVTKLVATFFLLL